MAKEKTTGSGIAGIPMYVYAIIAFLVIGGGYWWFSKKTTTAAAGSGSDSVPTPVTPVATATTTPASNATPPPATVIVEYLNGNSNRERNPPDRTGLLQQQAFLGNFPAGTALPATGAMGQSINIGGVTYVYGQMGWTLPQPNGMQPSLQPTNYPIGTSLPASGQNGQTITIAGSTYIYQSQTGWTLLQSIQPPAFLGNFPAGTALPASGQNGQTINIGGRMYVYHVYGQNINPLGGDVIIYQGQTGWVYNAL